MTNLLKTHAALDIAETELAVQIVACGKQGRPFNYSERVQLSAAHRINYFTGELGH
jgi:hypothetical protein